MPVVWDTLVYDVISLIHLYESLMDLGINLLTVYRKCIKSDFYG